MNLSAKLPQEAWASIFRGLQQLPGYECNPIMAEIQRQFQAQTSEPQA